MDHIKLITILTCLGLSSTAFANGSLRGKSFSPIPQEDKLQELNLNQEFVKTGRDIGISNADVGKVVPLNLRTTNDGNFVRDQILLKSASSVANSDFIKNNALFKSAKNLEKAAKVDMNIKPVKTVLAPNPTEHKFNIDVQAFKKEARLTYKGYVESLIEYKGETDSFRFMVEEKLSKNSKIVLTHTKNHHEKRQLVQYQVSW